MNKLQKVVIGLLVASAVGFTYLITVLNSMPEAFDWEDEDDE